MSRARRLAVATAFVAAATTTTGVAWLGAAWIERSSDRTVSEGLATAGLTWVDVRTDGLQLILTGFAPDERARFRAVTQAGRLVDPRRVIDAMDVLEAAPSDGPRFALEILRNEDAVSVIGLMATPEGKDALSTLLGRDDLVVTDMVERIDRATPDGWEAAVGFAVQALDLLPRAKISVQPGRVRVTAVADSDAQKRQLETDLARARPDALTLEMEIAAPRPVIAPFTLRFAMPEGAPPRFEACAVDDEAARTAVLRAAVAVGHEGKANCVIALGVPSASWGEAASVAIAALGQLGGGTVTLSDADVTLVARAGTDPDLFERIAAELKTALPEIFALTAVLSEAPDEAAATGPAGAAVFTATRSPEGQVQLRGRLYDEAQEAAVLSYGRALFGVQDTYIATRQDTALPQGWPLRVLTAMDALSHLESGSVAVRPDLVAVRGITGDRQAEADISRLLSAKLGAEAAFSTDIDYREELDPALNIPTPEDCVERLNAVLVAQKLTFAPGEAVIDAAGDSQLGRLNETLEPCERSVFEIGGHTDSQGREEMNQSLSQARAEAVRAALIARGAPPGQLTARGYGEAEPMADNGTEDGREANRRIAFTLVGGRDGGAGRTGAGPAGGTDDAAPVPDAPAADGEADR